MQYISYLSNLMDILTIHESNNTSVFVGMCGFTLLVMMLVFTSLENMEG